MECIGIGERQGEAVFCICACHRVLEETDRDGIRGHERDWCPLG